MNQREKSWLQQAFAAPPPQRREVFLRKLPTPAIRSTTFVFTQIRYIRRTVWAASTLVFAAALLCAYMMPEHLVGLTSALLPFVAVTAVSESTRSEVCGMSELETASRFSRKSLLFARLTILGILHGILLAFLIPLFGRFAMLSLVQSGTQVLIPYLLTTILCLHVSRHVAGRETSYLCTTVAALISGSILIQWDTPLPLWWADAPMLLIVLALAVLTVLEYRKQLTNSEEFLWNYELTN
ncbi:MAG: hypothetical protein Q4F79_01145 [Eubacteriales bacterium]|nr:hypothetical protein [Eubacteriales bacterium]